MKMFFNESEKDKEKQTAEFEISYKKYSRAYQRNKTVEQRRNWKCFANGVLGDLCST